MLSPKCRKSIFPRRRRGRRFRNPNRVKAVYSKQTRPPVWSNLNNSRRPSRYVRKRSVSLTVANLFPDETHVDVTVVCVFKPAIDARDSTLLVRGSSCIIVDKIFDISIPLAKFTPAVSSSIQLLRRVYVPIKEFAQRIDARVLNKKLHVILGTNYKCCYIRKLYLCILACVWCIHYCTCDVSIRVCAKHVIHPESRIGSNLDNADQNPGSLGLGDLQMGKYELDYRSLASCFSIFQYCTLIFHQSSFNLSNAKAIVSDKRIARAIFHRIGISMRSSRH